MNVKLIPFLLIGVGALRVQAPEKGEKGEVGFAEIVGKRKNFEKPHYWIEDFVLDIVSPKWGLGKKYSQRAWRNMFDLDEFIDIPFETPGNPFGLVGHDAEDVTTDHNGKMCDMCEGPPDDKFEPGKKPNYVQRKDCGKNRPAVSAADAVDPMKNLNSPEYNKKLVDYWKPATETDPGMDAFCELNVAKICSDARLNKDFMYYAKAINRSRSTPAINIDAQYCYHNGLLNKENVALVNGGNFSAIQAQAEEICNGPKYMKHNWKEMSLKSGFFDTLFAHFNSEAAVSVETSERWFAWNCAMGTGGCDMAYCAYTFCDKGGDKVGAYDRCEQWDPINGMKLNES